MSQARWLRAPPSAKTTSACRSRRIDGGAGASHPDCCREFSMWRRIGICVVACLLMAAAAARADDYPNRPIRLLIHTGPGSLVDVLGRLVGQELGQRLGQSVIADNRPGAATMI